MVASTSHRAKQKTFRHNRIERRCDALGEWQLQSASATVPHSSSDDSLSLRTSWLVGGKTLAFVFGSGVPLLLVRRMPQHEFGLYKQIFLVVNSAVTLLPLGFGMTAFYFLPRDEAHRNHTVFNIVLFTTAVATLF